MVLYLKGHSVTTLTSLFLTWGKFNGLIFEGAFNNYVNKMVGVGSWSNNTMEDLLLFNRNKLFQGDHIRLLEFPQLLGIL